MDVRGLAVRVLQHITERAVQHARLAMAERGGVVAGLVAAAAGLDADQLDAVIADERIEHAGRVAAAADAGDDDIGQPADLLEALLSRLAADDRLEIADHDRKRMRPDDAADDVVGVFDAGHPVAHGLVDGVAQGPAAAGDADDLGAHGPHLEDVELLPANVFLAHVDLALEARTGPPPWPWRRHAARPRSRR